MVQAAAFRAQAVDSLGSGAKRRKQTLREIREMHLLLWWAQQDSNLRPTDYESAALTD